MNTDYREQSTEHRNRMRSAQCARLLHLCVGTSVLWTFFGALAWVGTSHAQPIAAKELIEHAERHDGETVSCEGEVVGDIMRRRDGAWVNIHDGVFAIGVWAPLSLIKDITYAGSYTAKGDWVEVTGVFYRACPVHGGDLDIHATTLKKKMAGRRIVEPLHVLKRNYVFILTGVLCLVLMLTRLART